MFGPVPDPAPVDFNATDPNFAHSNYGSAIDQGLGQTYNQGAQTADAQSQLAQQLWAQANGQGPSLAQAQLRDAMQANVANTAGGIAGQRGINTGLRARLISQQGAQLGQQYAGQGAQLRLQEQMAARDALARALAAQRGQDIQQQQANTGQLGIVGGLQNQQSGLDVTGQLGTDKTNADVAEQNTKNQVDADSSNAAFWSNIIGSTLNAAGSVATLGLKPKFNGGRVGYADGGQVRGGSPCPPEQGPMFPDDPSKPTGGQRLMNALQFILSPGPGIQLNQPQRQKMAYGGAIPHVRLPRPFPEIRGIPRVPGIPGKLKPLGSYKQGGKIPGQAEVPGDSPMNDTKTIQVSPDEGVVPRTAMESPLKAAQFAAKMASDDASPAEVAQSKAFLSALRSRHGKFAHGGRIPDMAEERGEKQGLGKMQKELSTMRKSVEKLTKAMSKLKAVA